MAADREAKTEKHVITPRPLAPAHEQLVEMLLEMNRLDEALKEFEAVQLAEPNRFRAIYGSGRAAELTGDREGAKGHYTKLIAIAAKADTARPKIATAQAFMAAS